MGTQKRRFEIMIDPHRSLHSKRTRRGCGLSLPAWACPEMITITYDRQITLINLGLCRINSLWPNAYHSRLPLPCDVSNGQESFWSLGRGHHNPIWFDDTSLLGRDLCQCISKNLHMIVADRGDNRDNRLCDICGIQATAKPYFDNGVAHLLACKVEQCQCSANFVGN